MPGKVGRPSRADLAARAAQQASEVARTETVEIEPVETPTPPEPSRETDNPEPQRVAPRNENRRQAMEEIEARDLQSKSETGLRGQLGLTDEEPKEKAVTPQDPPPPTAESMLQGGKFSQNSQKQTVDGVEYDVSPEEIEEAGGPKAWRIARAQENRLQKINDALAEVQKAKAETQKPTPQSQSDWMKERVEKLRWGTPEESSQALNEILESKNKPIDQNQLVQMATDQMRHDEAVKNFDKEFTDIGANRYLLKLVVAERNERLQKGHPGDWNHFYRSIGNEIRANVMKQSQPTTSPKSPDTPSQVTDKEERKSSSASVVNLPQASQRASLPEEPKQETRTDTINSMRKARGLPIA